MALQRVETDAIEDDAVTTAKIAANAVAAADIAADAITNVKVAAGAAIAVSKITGLGTAATLTAGTAANNVVQLDGSGNLPAVSGVNLTNVSTDTSAMENNLAILAFKTQTANNLAKFNLIDQVVDEYYDTTGIDASASTGEITGGSGIAKYYSGGTSATVSGNYDDSGTDGIYSWYKWTTVRSDGTFTTNTAENYEYLIIAGGGGGGTDVGSKAGGGGGAGGYRTATGFAVASTTISSITIGAGGAADTNGGNSVFSTITSTGGGGGGTADDAGSAGGSSGGGGSTATSVASSPAGQGFTGGTGAYTAGGHYSGGGGGGAGQAGFNSDAGTDWAVGGYGLTSSIDGTALQRGGGGGGGHSNNVSGDSDITSGGAGGGGHGGDRYTATAATAGTANTGSGGGGGHYEGAPLNSSRAAGIGGSGIIIIRKPTSAGGGNLTLQSVANTALTAPTTGDICMLIENSSGTATLNTDIKAWVSRNGGTGWDQATLVDKGTWGSGTKKIVTANNVAFSNSASGTDMRYKITTHNQSAGTKETRIHATSLAWA
jgi:hypothetical protein